MEGGRLFDAARFFEAHDAWEEAWRLERGETRRVLQGLIQVAAGFHKGLVQGRPAGMVTLLERGLANLDPGARAGSLALDGFRAEVGRWVEAAQRWAASGERPTLHLPRLGGA